MEAGRREMRLRGGILAAAAVLGVPIHFSDSERWEVADGTVTVGLGSVAADTREDTAVARVLLQLWESVREARTAPHRRARRLALARRSPELEPALAVIDRLLAGSEILAALPSQREPLGRAISELLPSAPEELPRHLQWLCAVLALWVDPRGGAEYAERGASEVREALTALGEIGGAGAVEQVLRRAFAPDPSRTPLQRFERAYALIVPPYERLLRLDESTGGIDSRGDKHTDVDEQGADLADFGAGAGSDSEDAKPGGDAEHASSDSADERARAGDERETAEGADLFAAEQAAFVAAVLDTPLPADGAWVEGLPDTQHSEPQRDETQRTPRDVTSAGDGTARPPSATAMREYRDRTRELAPHIERMRNVWRTIIAERVGTKRLLARLPEADGEVLDRESLVRIVSESVAGVRRPNAFLPRRHVRTRTKREGSTDYVLVIDRSASMRGAAAEAAATAALIMLESLSAVERDIAAEERAVGIDLELSLRTALIVYDTVSMVVKPLSGALDDRIRRRMHAEILSPQGSTNDAVALDAAARELGLRGAAASAGAQGIMRRRIVIVVGDGGTDDEQRARAGVQRLREAGVTVMGIGIRTDDLIARYAPGGLRLDDPKGLPEALEELIMSFGIGDVD